MKTSTLEGRASWFIIALWLLVVTFFGYYGATTLLPSWGRGPLVLGITLILYLAYLFHRGTQSAVERIPDAALVALHAWRAVAGFAFLYWGSLGLLPATFVRNAAYGDIAIAILVPLVLTLPESRAVYFGFHILGLADLLVAVGTGLALTFQEDPLIQNMFTFPLVLIPLFAVPLTLASHLIALTRLFRRKKG